jgi:hypothetical protein
MAVKLPALSAGSTFTLKKILGTVSFQRLSPRAIVLQQGLGALKNAIALSGIEPATACPVSCSKSKVKSKAIPVTDRGGL